MKRCLRLLLCLLLLTTTACAADAIAGPKLVPEPEAVAQLVSEPAAVQDAATADGFPPRIVILGLEGSPTPTEPLCLIDGVPALSADAQARMEADDIDSIEVLTGEALSALYGNRLLTPVVIITTRHAAHHRRR